jgi:hypothetical protein
MYSAGQGLVSRQDEVDALLGMFHRRGNLLNAVPIARISPDPGVDKFNRLRYCQKS